MPAQLLLVFHSQSGRNETLALHMRQAASAVAQDCEEPVSVVLKRAWEADSDDFCAADLIVMIAPENFGNISGGLKDFLDRVFYPAERAEALGKPYALVLDTGNSGTGCIQRIETIMQGLNARQVQAPLVLYGKPDDAAIAQARELAEALVVGLDMGVF
ncbi:Uncharacterised protein [BD1-7 clade bacterium]|uniref:Flavodoxin-like domain-containing protein n=1 Tax=BD1-7 clade bacterium TaxID=2029982 RepID=A0A5S9PQH5_9GAMM|nr:Uncharacterised protein [BD1-7 clade bacterium]